MRMPHMHAHTAPAPTPQIRLAKDTRTGHETADVAGLLDGDLEPFTTAYLRLKGRRAAEERLAAAA
jgi:peptide chain release factor 2